MSFILLLVQAAVFGAVATIAFPDLSPEFWIAIIVNSASVVLYGVACRSEK